MTTDETKTTGAAMLEALLEMLVAKVAERVLAKLEPQAPAKFEETVGNVLQNADWFKGYLKEFVAEQQPDFGDAVREVVGNMDLFEGRAFGLAVEFCIDAYNMSDKIESELDEYDLDTKIKRVLRDVCFTVSVE